ncbi:MAG: 1-acyl-sn-glycerol-3-phosphate acyltransferase, partial [Solirubrobacterales bacterium]|nr:1-acyl-sn-glycerol-3-phosphate acyltransferase [Solirubrobacterales bacterium]
ALQTARALLEAGEPVVLFLEGTRVDDPDVLGSPHHGAARLAVETGAPIVPVAISGTAHLWLGPVPKPHHVRIALLEPVAAPAGRDGPEVLGELIDRRVWPAVQEEYGRLQATPGVVLTALTAAGLGAGLAARRARRPPPRILGVVPPRRERHRDRRRALLERLRPRPGRLARIRARLRRR